MSLSNEQLLYLSALITVGILVFIIGFIFIIHKNET